MCSWSAALCGVCTVERVASPILLQFVDESRHGASDELRELGRIVVADLDLFLNVVIRLHLPEKIS